MKDFQKAKKLYFEAIDHEKSGRFDDAIRCYKTAFLLEPEIDTKIYENEKSNNKEIKINEKASTSSLRCAQSDDNETDVEPLIDRFEKNVFNNGKICEPNKVTRSTHISDLPPEMIRYIFNWVVSDNLDLRSLDKCAQVCQGFYLCARDGRLWKSACERIWGISKDISPYADYRDMYLNRLRIEMDGCYICESKYYRVGENSFMDRSVSFNQPCYLVKYYRFIRFFLDGTALVTNSTDEPQKLVSKLRSKKTATADICVGNYTVDNDIICLNFFNRKNSSCPRFNIEYTMVFWLKRCISHRIKCTKLVWKSLTIRSNGSSTNTENFSSYQQSNRFPPFIFSRVRSYMAESEYPLDESI